LLASLKVNEENSRIRIQDPDPDPLARGMYPRIQIRIHPKMSWIRNIVFFRVFRGKLTMRAILIPELFCGKRPFTHNQITSTYAIGPQITIFVGQRACRFYPKFEKGKSHIFFLSGMRNSTHIDIKSRVGGWVGKFFNTPL
jgi:hypothetical protein